jgi:cytochrome b561
MSIAFPKSEAEIPAELSLPHVAKVLHWLTALLVLGLFATGVTMKQLGQGPAADLMHLGHKTTGVLLLCVVLVRIGYRLFAQVTARWQKGAASRPVHALLYLVLLVVPLLGWAGASGFGSRQLLFGFSLPEIWSLEAGHAELLLLSHAWLAFGLIALVVVHIGLALGDYLVRDSRAD